MTVAEFPAKLQFLFKPARYKVAYGGRGSAKSWGFARACLIHGAREKKRIICARDFQNSIDESVHALLSDQIPALGLGDFYQVLDTEIRGRNGTEFSFRGLRRNVESIKSFEAADICWVEEAQTVSKNSWSKLIPTIRKPGSEIWVTFNPDLAEDETYQRFVLRTPPDAICVEMNWRDNPWFPDVLEQERRYLAENDRDEYLNVWEGKPRESVAGAIFASELRQARLAGRITKVPHDRSLPVHTAWDLGRSDATAIWFIQQAGLEYRVIDYYEATGHAIDHYLGVLQQRGYVYGTDYVPHDGKNKVIHHAKSIEQQMKAAGRNVKIVPRVARVADYINATRQLFSRLYFDEEKTADGLSALRHWHYGVNEDTGKRTAEPYHDWSSHGSVALCQFAMGIREGREASASPASTAISAGGWMT